MTQIDVFCCTLLHILYATSIVFRPSNCTKIVGGWGFAPDPTGGAYSAPPDPLAGFRGPTSKAPTSKGREREGRGGEEAPHELKPNSAHALRRCAGGYHLFVIFAVFDV